MVVAVVVATLLLPADVASSTANCRSSNGFAPFSSTGSSTTRDYCVFQLTVGTFNPDSNTGRDTPDIAPNLKRRKISHSGERAESGAASGKRKKKLSQYQGINSPVPFRPSSQHDILLHIISYSQPPHICKWDPCSAGGRCREIIQDLNTSFGFMTSCLRITESDKVSESAFNLKSTACSILFHTKKFFMY